MAVTVCARYCEWEYYSTNNDGENKWINNGSSGKDLGVTVVCKLNVTL